MDDHPFNSQPQPSQPQSLPPISPMDPNQPPASQLSPNPVWSQPQTPQPQSLPTNPQTADYTLGSVAVPADQSAGLVPPQGPVTSPATISTVPVGTTIPSTQPPLAQALALPPKENIYTEICSQIITEQSRIMGLGLALEQTKHVEGLSVDPKTLHCDVVGDGSKVINDLIESYSSFFGKAAVEVCREAAAKFLVNLPLNQTPTLLMQGHPQNQP